MDIEKLFKLLSKGDAEVCLLVAKKLEGFIKKQTEYKKTVFFSMRDDEIITTDTERELKKLISGIQSFDYRIRNNSVNTLRDMYYTSRR